MYDQYLRPGECLDDLLIDDLKIIQHADGFKFAIDAVLLAHFATLKQGNSTVDLGAGTGVIGLLLAARGAGRVVGVELNRRMAEMARRSVALNGLADRVRMLEGDVRAIKGLLHPGEWDLVVSNPPYRPVGWGRTNPSDALAIARHEITVTLQDIVDAAGYLLKYHGRLAMVHLPERLVAVLKTMSTAGIEPKRLRLVYPSVERKPALLLVEGIKGANAGLDVLPPLFIYEAGGDYSREVLGYYRTNR